MVDPEAVREYVRSGVAAGVFPGAAYAFGTAQRVETGFAGCLFYSPDSTPVGPDTVYDLASVTKVVATTSAAMQLSDDGLLDIDRTVASYLPAFSAEGKGEITVRNLLLHNSGLIAHRLYYEFASSPDDGWNQVCMEPLEYAPGTTTVYSCIGFLTLYRVIACVLLGEIGQDSRRHRDWADEYEGYLRERVFGPLGMGSTVFNPSEWVRPRCAPTELKTNYRKRLLQGEVHDENAHFLGGTSGNAGLFSTIGDMTKFALALVRGGSPVFNATTLKEWRTRQSDDSTRGLGWDTKCVEGSSAGTRFSAESFGHLGFTGTSVWIDPLRECFAVLLTNRVHPSRDNLQMIDFRPSFHDLAFESLH